MTIKTLLKLSDTNIETIRRSDMQKRGAVRNLFNTTVDRDELQKQRAQLENESLQTLQSYKLDSIIGVIPSANDQARKLKFARFFEPDEASGDEEEPPRMIRDSIDSDGASSSADQEQPSLTSTSKKSSDLKLIASAQKSLPRGQKTLKGEKIYFLLFSIEKKVSGFAFVLCVNVKGMRFRSIFDVCFEINSDFSVKFINEL